MTAYDSLINWTAMLHKEIAVSFEYTTPEQMLPRKVLISPYLDAKYLPELLSGKIVSYTLLRKEGHALANFYISPEGYVYNTDLNKKSFLKFLDLRNNIEELKRILQADQLTKNNRKLWQQRLMLLEKQCIYSFSSAKVEAYIIEYPEYYWQTLAEAEGKKHKYLVHMTPGREYEIYRNQEHIPRQTIKFRQDLSKKLFNKDDYLLIQELFIEKFQGMSVELLSKKYSEIHGPKIIAAIKQGQGLENAEQLLAEIELTQQTQISKQEGHNVLLCQDARYMILAGSSKYAEAKQQLQDIQQKAVHHYFDDAIFDFYMGNYQQALDGFALLRESPDPSVRLPAILNSVKALLKLGLKQEAYVVFLENFVKIQSPSPRVFPVFYSQVFDNAGGTVTGDHLYAPKDVQDVLLLEDDPRALFERIVSHYSVEMYFNRERAIRNLFLEVIGKDLKLAGDLQRLKAIYIVRGLFGMHQLLRDFLRSEKYTQKILAMSKLA